MLATNRSPPTGCLMPSQGGPYVSVYVSSAATLPVICVETWHMPAVLKAQINKTDRNDARGMAQMMRAGLYRPVHVKTLDASHDSSRGGQAFRYLSKNAIESETAWICTASGA
jgi:hypothetical protein